MTQAISSIFSGPPKPKGPDPELLAAQKAQADALAAKDAEETQKKNARAAALAGRQGRGHGVTLYVPTGEGGVGPQATLGS